MRKLLLLFLAAIYVCVCKAYVEAARQAGRKKVTLTCKKRLIGMYEHFGFRLIGQARSEHGGAQWFDMDLNLS